MSKRSIFKKLDQPYELDCNRLFLEEFEDLNNGLNSLTKLTYNQEVSGRKGF